MPETPPPSSSEGGLTVGSLSYAKLGLASTIFWLLLGEMAWALKGRAGQPTTQLLLGQYGATDNFSSMLVGSIPSGFAFFALPVLGFLSDRFRGNLGRRIPFLMLTVPFATLATVGIAGSLWLGSTFDEAFQASGSGTITCLSVFWTWFAFTDILGTLILNALFNDVIPQRILGRFFGGTRIVALLAGIFFNYYLFGIADSAAVPILVGIAAFVLITLGLVCVMVKEGTYPPPPPDPKGAAEITQEIQGYFRDCFGSRFYLLLFAAWALGSTAWSPVNYYSVLFSRQFITTEHYGNLLTLTFAISLVLAYPLGMLADRFHPLRLGMGALALYALGSLWGGFFATTQSTFDIAFVLHGVLSGAYMSATASLLLRLLPRMKFAQFASAAGAMICLCNVMIIPFASYLLNMTHHDYRYLFLLGAVQSTVGLVATFYCYRAFLARGGDRHYVAES